MINYVRNFFMAQDHQALISQLTRRIDEIENANHPFHFELMQDEIDGLGKDIEVIRKKLT